MEKQVERKDDGLNLPKDAQINLVLNNQDPEEDTIDLGRVFHRFKEKTRVFAWLLLFCLVAGISAGLLFYQINKKPLTVASVVTLRYDVNIMRNGRKVSSYKVSDLTAPDGSSLDLSQISSSYVLQTALQGVELSTSIPLSALQKKIAVQRIPTEAVRRQQELINSMMENTSTVSAAYEKAQQLEVKYTNRFIVTLTNGFGDEDSGLVYLEAEELRVLLDRILSAYNDYLIREFSRLKVPSDEISIIDTEVLDTMESLDLLRTAMENLTDFCDEQDAEIRKYRSWKSGNTLEELKRKAELVKAVDLGYLYAHVASNGIAQDKASMLTLYQYDLRTAETELTKVNEDIAAVQALMDKYKNDEIFVTTQESDSTKATTLTTDYYNGLVTAQAENYSKVTALKITINDLQGKIASLNNAGETGNAEDVSAELQRVFAVCGGIYGEISDQITEIVESPLYRTFAEASVAQGKSESFLTGAMKNMLMFGAVGAVIALALWFFSALAPELRHMEEEKRKKPAEAEGGKEAADHE